MNIGELAGFYNYQSPKIKEAFMIGYKPQFDAGLGVVCKVLRNIELKNKKPDCRMLIFGLAGTGKTSYPKALLKNFNEDVEIQNFLMRMNKRNASKIDVKLFHVSCLEVIDTYRQKDSLSSFINRLDKTIADNIPAMVFFDEIDAFCPERTRQSEFINTWTMQFMKKNHGGLAIFGIVNEPSVIDPAVLRKFKHMFYFEFPPSEDVVTGILDLHKIPFSRQIARKLCINPVDAGELVEGIMDAIEFLGNGKCNNLRSISADEIADFLNDYLHISWEKIWNYEDRNKFYIDKTKNPLDFWKQQKDKLMKI